MTRANRAQDLEARLRRGIAAQAAGRLPDAEACYRGVLSIVPDLADARHLLAQARFLQGDHREAIAQLDRAIAASPRVAAYRATRGTVLRAAGRLEDAIAAFEDAVALDPGHSSAHRSLASACVAQGDLEGARRAFLRAVGVAPGDGELWLGLAQVLSAAGRPGEAAAAAERAVELDPTSRRAIDAWIAAAEAAVALPIVAGKLEALCHRHADSCVLRRALVDVLARCGRNEDALALAEDVIDRWPDDVEGWRLAGIRRAACGDNAGAQAAFDRVLQRRPDDATAMIGAGNALHRTGRSADGLALIRTATRQHPGCKEAWYNAGTILSALGRETEAIVDYEHAIAIDPDFASARGNRAHGLLRLGRFREAWPENRWRAAARGPLFPDQPWPRDMSGMRVHLAAEQGIGDQLFFLRFAPLAVARGADVTVECGRRIETIVARAGFQVVPHVPDGAQVASMADLAYLLGADDELVPPPLPLPVLDEARAEVERRLAELPRPLIAVTWHAGGVMGRRETFKTIPVTSLGSTLRDVPGTILSVQRMPVAADHETLERSLEREVIDLSAWNDALETMLALMAVLDAYAGVSNTNVHLRAGAGRGSDVMAQFPIDWRWRALDDGTVPWYPGSRAHFQAADRTWDAAFASLRIALTEQRT